GDLEIIAKLAGVVAASHRRAPIIGGANAGQALQRQIEETLISFEAAPGISPRRCARTPVAASLDPFTTRSAPVFALEREQDEAAAASH
ncbi:MAG: hypothetical protein CR217_19475, partial [Beijerinckiaceae bacterium]